MLHLKFKVPMSFYIGYFGTLISTLILISTASYNFQAGICILYQDLSDLEAWLLYVNMIHEKCFTRLSWIWRFMVAKSVSISRKSSICGFVGCDVQLPEAGVGVANRSMILYMMPFFFYSVQLIRSRITLAFLFFTYMFCVCSSILQKIG